jgi:plasmid stabilization system protein ParE
VRLVVLEPAEQDLCEAATACEDARKGAGERLLRSMRWVLADIAEAPRTSPVIQRTRQLRRCRMTDFPYSVYYRIGGGVVVVLAVLHGARHPRTLHW